MEMNSQKKLKRHIVFPFSHSAVGFWKVLAAEMNHKKDSKRHMDIMFFSGLIEVCVLEGSGCENQFTKRN